MNKLQEKIKEVQNLLFGQITQGLVYFYCARSLHQAFQESPLMKASYFFVGVYQAAEREAILALARITEEHPDSITIDYLFNLVENNARLFSPDSPESVGQAVADHKARLEKYEPLIESIFEQRDRVGAHLDRKHVNNPSNLFAHPHGVNLTELGECLWDVLDVLNFYARYYEKGFDPRNLESGSSPSNRGENIIWQKRGPLAQSGLIGQIDQEVPNGPTDRILPQFGLSRKWTSRQRKHRRAQSQGTPLQVPRMWQDIQRNQRYRLLPLADS